MATTEPRSVLFIGNYLSRNRGTRAVTEDLSLRLESLGWRVIRASGKANKVLRMADMLITIWRRRADYDVAVVDVYSGQAFRFAEFSAALLTALGKPFVLLLHGGRLPEFALSHQRRVRRLLARATAVVSPSRYLLERMRNLRPDAQLIPNPISLEQCRYVPRHRVAPKLAWLRAYHHVYNLPMAIQVVERLLHQFPEIRLTAIGPDKGDGTLAEVQAQVALRNLAEHVRLQGAVDKEQVPGCLNQGDIFLNTTNIDNTPVSVLEAMACGLCVVSTDVGGIPYLLEDGVDSLLVPRGDAAACAAAVERLLKDDALAARLSAAARRKAEAFDWQRVLPQWQSLLLNLIPARSSARPLAPREVAGH